MATVPVADMMKQAPFRTMIAGPAPEINSKECLAAVQKLVEWIATSMYAFFVINFRHCSKQVMKQAHAPAIIAMTWFPSALAECSIADKMVRT